MYHRVCFQSTSWCAEVVVYSKTTTYCENLYRNFRSWSQFMTESLSRRLKWVCSCIHLLQMSSGYNTLGLSKDNNMILPNYLWALPVYYIFLLKICLSIKLKLYTFPWIILALYFKFQENWLSWKFWYLYSMELKDPCKFQEIRL